MNSPPALAICIWSSTDWPYIVLFRTLFLLTLSAALMLVLFTFGSLALTKSCFRLLPRRLNTDFGTFGKRVLKLLYLISRTLGWTGVLVVLHIQPMLSSILVCARHLLQFIQSISTRDLSVNLVTVLGWAIKAATGLLMFRSLGLMAAHIAQKIVFLG